MAVPALLAGAAGLLTLPVLASAVFLGSGAADPPPAGTVCILAPADPGGAPAGGAGPADPAPAGAVTLTGEQAANARTIVAAARALGLPARAAVVALMAAAQESDLLVLANPTVPESAGYPHQGTGTNLDSVGLFQQRPSQGWGPVGQLMDPATSASLFLTRLAAVPGWPALPGWQAAQAVQASADGTRYAAHEPLATALTAALWDSRSPGGLVCTTPTVAGLTGPGGTFAAEACSVRPDPSTGRGCLTPRTLNLYLQLAAQGWTTSCWDPHAWNPRSDHPRGQACDVFPGPAGTLPSPEQKARGDALLAAVLASAPHTGVSYVIWYGQYCPATSPCRPYTGGGVYNPRDITGGHYDHLHISVR